MLASGSATEGASRVVDGFGNEDWFEAWYEAFAAGVGRYRLKVSGLGYTPELIPGMTSICRRRVRFLRAPVNCHSPRYGWRMQGLRGAGELGAAVRGLLGRSGCRGVELDLLPADGGTIRILQELARDGHWVAAIEETERTVLTEIGGDWQAYRRSLPASLKKDLRQDENRLRRKGRVDFAEVGQNESWRRWFDEALRLEAAGWKGRAGTAILHHANELEFYRRVTDRMAAAGRLRLFILTLDGHLIAFQLATTEEGVLFLLKTAYHEAYSDCSPGTALTHRMLEYCFHQGELRAVDHVGSKQWTRVWSTRSESLVRVRLVPSLSVVGMLLRLETRAKRLREEFLVRFRRDSSKVETEKHTPEVPTEAGED
jgi:hypothetical protein